MDDKELVKVCNDKVWYANVENTVGVKTIGQLGVTNDNDNKQKKMNNKMKDVSTRNTRGFKRLRKIVPIEIRNE